MKKVMVATPATEMNEIFATNNLTAKYSSSCPIKYPHLIQESLECI